MPPLVIDLIISFPYKATFSGTGRYDALVEDDKSECSPFVLLPDHWSVTFTIHAARDAKDAQIVNKALPSPLVPSKTNMDDVYHTDWVRKLKVRSDRICP